MNTLLKLKRSLFLSFVLAFLAIGFTATKAQAQYYGNDYYDDSYQIFYNELAPYGQWFNDPQYGYVWMPNAGRNFRPYYTNGYWTMTEYGNMWVSGYAWGWATFHYGRWAFNPMYGWIWVPGTQWGPAWVTWRSGGGYYGWAPMAPGLSIYASFSGGYYNSYNYWTFIPYRHIYSRTFHRYYAPRRSRNIIYNTTIVNNTYVDNRSNNTYVTGPRRSDVERQTGQRVNQYRVTPSGRAGTAEVRSGEIEVFRPRIQEGSGRNQAAPREVRQVERSIISVPDNNSAQNGQGTRMIEPKGSSLNLEQPGNVRGREVKKVEQTVQPNRNIERTQPVQPQRNTKPQVEPQRSTPQQNVSPEKRVVPNNTQPSRGSKTVVPQSNTKQVQPTKRVQPTRQIQPQNNNVRSTSSNTRTNVNVERNNSVSPARNVQKSEPRVNTNTKRVERAPASRGNQIQRSQNSNSSRTIERR